MALSQDLILPDIELSDTEIYNLLFTSGFSTSPEVTNISGRGVGMDVLKSNVESLNGTVELASTPGEGTCVSIALPLTLAIIDCLLVDIGWYKYLLPLLSVEECVELSSRDISNAHGKKLLAVRGEAVPYIDLREVFDVGGELPDLRQVVITGSNGSRIGFAVDSVVGEHQTVIKPLGAFYRSVDCVAGATVLGDGSVALIVDTENIVAASVGGNS
jgi:two-component system chemotaxis sensor kinase CheA